MLAPAATSPVATVLLWILVGYLAVSTVLTVVLLIGATIRQRHMRDQLRRAEILALNHTPVLPYDPEGLPR